jgi:hypothetical protein
MHFAEHLPWNNSMRFIQFKMQRGGQNDKKIGYFCDHDCMDRVDWWHRLFAADQKTDVSGTISAINAADKSITIKDEKGKRQPSRAWTKNTGKLKTGIWLHARMSQKAERMSVKPS